MLPLIFDLFQRRVGLGTDMPLNEASYDLQLGLQGGVLCRKT